MLTRTIFSELFIKQKYKALQQLIRFDKLNHNFLGALHSAHDD